jgi:hypothetical protein
MPNNPSVRLQADVNANGSGVADLEINGVSVGKRLADVLPLSPTLPKLQLPQGNRKYSECAREMFTGMAATGKYFVRDEVLLTCNEKGETSEITASKLQSRVEKVFHTYKLDKKGDEYPVLLTSSEASTLLDTEELVTHSNPLRLIVQVPPLIAEAGTLRLLDLPGYHPETGGLWVVSIVPNIRLDMPLDEAKRWLTDELFTDYDFVTPGDLSRAVAQVISPALKIGGLLGDADYPMDLGLANKSQSGKTHRMKFTAWLYGERPHSKAPSKGGVGSLDESIGAALHSGKPFLLFDNVRGDLDSQVLESVLRGAKQVSVRLPYSKEVSIDTTRAIIQLTSNDASPTKDLMNRSLILSNRKRAKDYKPVLPWGDDFFPYVERNRSQYLSAIYSLINEWWKAGKPKTGEARHDFREWVQPMDWIVQNLLGLAPLVDGQTSVTAGWFREIVRHLEDTQIGVPLEARDLLRVADAHDIEIPGDTTKTAGIDGDRVRLQNLGRKLSNQIFRDAAAVTVDGFMVERSEKKDENSRSIRVYTVR